MRGMIGNLYHCWRSDEKYLNSDFRARKSGIFEKLFIFFQTMVCFLMFFEDSVSAVGSLATGEAFPWRC